MWASYSLRQTNTKMSSRIPFVIQTTVSPSRYTPETKQSQLRPSILVQDRYSKVTQIITPGPGEYQVRPKSQSCKKANLVFSQIDRKFYFDQFKSTYELPDVDLNRSFRNNQIKKYPTKLYRSDRSK